MIIFLHYFNFFFFKLGLDLQLFLYFIINHPKEEHSVSFWIIITIHPVGLWLVSSENFPPFPIPEDFIIFMSFRVLVHIILAVALQLVAACMTPLRVTSCWLCSSCADRLCGLHITSQLNPHFIHLS